VASSVAAVVALAWLRLRRCGYSPAVDGQQQQQSQEMEWDNSAFNITVNPLDRDAEVRSRSTLLIQFLSRVLSSTVLPGI